MFDIGKDKKKMRTLNLEAKNAAQQRIKEYLEQNASEVLAEKINNGVSIEKDGKILINKKTLDKFMIFATEEARKVAEQGARCACIEDSVVFGWAVHYFEEDSIEGTLYNEDGTEYMKPKPASKNTKKSKNAKKVELEEKAVEVVKETVTPPSEEEPPMPPPKKKKVVLQTTAPQMSFFDF